jgi:two-component system OmpR family sensor kinase
VSLRARLLIGLVLLAAAGLGVVAIVTYEEQRGFLLGRVDQQAQTAVAPVSLRLGLHIDAFPGGPHGDAGRPSAFGHHGAGDQGTDRGPGPQPFTIEPLGTYGELLSASGRVLQTAVFHYDQSAPSPPAIPASYPKTSSSDRDVQPFTVDSRAGSGLRYRVVAISVGGGRELIVAVPLGEVDQTLHRLIVVELLVVAGVIGALVLLGWIVIRIGLRPLERIGRVASEIAHGDLSRRVAPAGPRTEVGRLGMALNDMLAQIEHAFADRQRGEERLREFVADASHELRTPLASIRGYSELARLGVTSDVDELRRMMARIEAESARMGGLVEDLLLLARLDELPEVRRIDVDLRQLAEHAVQDARATAPERAIELAADGDEPAVVLGDPNQLRQVLANLLRNAIVHTTAGTPIDVTLVTDRGQVRIDVRDYGDGLPAGAGDRVFDRFWRSEGGRSRTRGGSGLGLAIVKALVQAHHGEVRAENAAGGGARFTVTLPLAAEDALAASASSGDSQVALAPSSAA